MSALGSMVRRLRGGAVDGERSPAAAWHYPDPSAAAAEIRGHIAFWRGVELRRAHRE